MRIGIVRKRYVLHGGAERYVERLIKELIGRGNEVHLFANKWNDTNERIIFHRVPIIGCLSFLKVLSFAFFADMKLRETKLDIIHSFERTFKQDVYRAGDGCHAEFLRQREKNLSFCKRWFIRLNPLHITTLFIEKRLFKRGNYKKIIANSNQVKEDIIRHYKVIPRDIVVIYNSVDTEEFNPEDRGLSIEERDKIGIDKNSILLLFVGSGFERKGLAALIEAVGDLNKQRKAVLLVVGKGRYRRYKRLAGRFGVEENIHFLGPQSNVKRFYLASDIFVLPSIYEPFSNACLEAMACGLPVITSRVNGVSELLEKDNEVRDLIIDEPRDSNEIAMRVAMLFEEEKRRRIGKRCKDIASRLTLSENVQKTLEVYQDIIN
ncbi:MAG: glycosyltransferase family 4 protein [Candidatus Omnitrophica bacterium]|nr:glycosyltransferase family 4 protein [Candidatus Omnitrophota bacterium]